MDNITKQLIDKCIKNDRTAQYEFYEIYSRKAFGTCLRYAKNQTDAEDILQEGFIKVFKYLRDYKGIGSIEGWIRRIIITTSLNYYKKKNLLNKEVDPEHVKHQFPADVNAISIMSHDELLKIIRQLPDGYQTVFNLNTIEGYTHKEISKIMNISVNTSKSQLSRAKLALRKKINTIFTTEEISIGSLSACAG